MEFLIVTGAVFLGSILKDVVLSFYVALAQRKKMKNRNAVIAEWEQRLLAQEAAEKGYREAENPDAGEA